jgi:type I site-specific restriction endonuclease
MNDPIFGKPIFTYTTKEAVEDGFLVEIDSENLI